MAKSLVNPFSPPPEHKTETTISGTSQTSTFGGFHNPGNPNQPATFGGFQTSGNTSYSAQQHGPSSFLPSHHSNPGFNPALYSNPQPVIVIPPNWSPPPNGNITGPSPAQYHLSFVNEADNLQVLIVNGRQHSINTRLVGRGTKFEIDVPIDQSISITIKATTSDTSFLPGQEAENRIVASVDNDPFGLRSKALTQF